MNVQEVNRAYDRQISYENISYKIDRTLFNLTINFTLKDWKEVRSEEYWQTKPTMESSHWKRKAHLLNYVRKYINSKNTIK
jgi:hypothetical protein